MVAESTEIFLPIDQFGCLIANFGVAFLMLSIFQLRKGPPDAVITISSTGNAIDFADAGHKIYGSGCLSNSTRGFFAAGGATNPAKSDKITMFNMQSGGFFTDFGTVRTAEDFYANGTSNATRGIFCGAYTYGPATGYNIIQFITISTAGDSQDFGELSAAAWGCNATSDSHGGLGGF